MRDDRNGMALRRGFLAGVGTAIKWPDRTASPWERV